MSNGNPLEWMGVSGVVALIAGVFGYGRLSERVNDHAETIKKMADVPVAVARLEVKAQSVADDVKEIKDSLKELARK